jgi:DNA-binding NtrC family response regulator
MRKILVIDDEKPTLSMFRLLVGAYGYKVLTAENGSTGIELFQRERPVLVFTDIKMPGLDGLEVLKRIKEIDPQVPIVVITGHGDTDLAKQATDMEATAFIHKPIQRKALEEALKLAGES